MKVLLVYPRFPQSFWSYNRFMEMAGLGAVIPPLGIITVAALLPPEWELRFCDRNVCSETDADWQWCDLVILSAMLVQKPDFLSLIHRAVAAGKTVAVGGPYPTSIPEDALAAGAHYLILDEGEITVPQFLAAVAQGIPGGIFRASEKPDVSQSPMPRFDLLQQNRYLMMAVQFSRGCPFSCEFCDIINLYGRKPRTKDPGQILAELQALYDLGWRGAIFMVDDNFIGNQRNVKCLLRELIPWMEARSYPFSFLTEASINLAEDDELLALMVQAGFYAVFLGIETPDQESLKATQKLQNTRNSLVDACDKIHHAGLVITAGFILGFDGERAGAGERIQAFVETTQIAQPMLGILQALPNTALWQRLEHEGRLQHLSGIGGVELGDQNSLMNFVPTRPIAEIAAEYLQSIWNLYEPRLYLQRCFHQCLAVSPPSRRQPQWFFPWFKSFWLLTQLIWYQGILRRQTRWVFWRQLWVMLQQKPQLLGLYLGLCAAGEHFFAYRHLAKERIHDQLQQLNIAPLPTAAAPLKSETLLTPLG